MEVEGIRHKPPRYKSQALLNLIRQDSLIPSTVNNRGVILIEGDHAVVRLCSCALMFFRYNIQSTGPNMDS